MAVTFADEALDLVIADERFWSTRFDPKVSVDPSGCWEWVGALTAHGYGVMGIRLNRRNVPVLAHRLAYARARGVAALPDGWDRRADAMVLDHKCNNRACVNPDHLRTIPRYLNSLRGRLRA